MGISSENDNDHFLADFFDFPIMVRGQTIKSAFEWIETTALGKCLVVLACLSLFVFFTWGIIEDPKVLWVAMLGILISAGGLFTYVGVVILVLFLRTRSLRKKK